MWPRQKKNGQFELRNWADAYLRDGHFDQNRMLALIQEVLEGGRQQGFPLILSALTDQRRRK